MPNRLTKLFPTPENCQRPNDTGAWPLKWTIAYLTDLFNKLPADEQPSAMIGPMAGVEIWYDKQLSQADVDRERIALLFGDIERRVQSNSGATVDDLKALIARFHALS